ncbi:hypothetical protein AKJ13_18000 [Methylobacterium sp. ARG-1]|nr:hypothetical protein AKJ13_18000 [Methylobacterium sp. ARG-1]
MHLNDHIEALFAVILPLILFDQGKSPIEGRCQIGEVDLTAGDRERILLIIPLGQLILTDIVMYIIMSIITKDSFPIAGVSV